MHTNEFKHIPLKYLAHSPNNMRCTPAPRPSQESMRTTIEQHNVLQNLIVRAVDDTHYLVVAGRRRLDALHALAEDDTYAAITADTPIPCKIIQTNGASDTTLDILHSVAENIERLPPNPIDTYEALDQLRQDGLDEHDIAHRLGLTVGQIRARLALERIHPELRETARRGELSSARLNAFARCPDQDRQLQQWRTHGTNISIADLKVNLTGHCIDSQAPIVRFVGIDTYLKKGGEVIRDLFMPNPDHPEQGPTEHAVLASPALLEQLVQHKLNTALDSLHDEGWGWTKAVRSRGEWIYQSTKLTPVADLDTLDPQTKATLGAMLWIDDNGTLQCQRALQRPTTENRAPTSGRSPASANPPQAPTQPIADGALTAPTRKTMAQIRKDTLGATVRGLRKRTPFLTWLASELSACAADEPNAFGLAPRVPGLNTDDTAPNDPFRALTDACARLLDARALDNDAIAQRAAETLGIEWAELWSADASYFERFTHAQLGELACAITDHAPIAESVEAIPTKKQACAILADLSKGDITSALEQGWTTTDAERAAHAFSRWTPKGFAPA